MEFKNIVIAGGALKVISVLGCIKYLEDKHLKNAINTFVGTSAGSILCLFLVLDYTFEEIFEFLYKNLSDKKINSFNPEECLNILSNYGFSSGENLDLLIERIIYKKLKQKDINFIELAKLTGKDLVVCVANLTKEKTEFFNVDTMPNLSVLTAIKVSCSVPIIFSPISINNDIYMDGGLYNNFPIDYFKNHNLRDILGINVQFSNYKKTDTFVDYIKFIISSLVEKVNVKSVTDMEKNIVTLDFEEDDWFSFLELSLKFPKENWYNFINFGYQEIKNKMEKKN